MQDILRQHTEALIFAAPEPIILIEIREALSESLETEVSEEAVLEAIDAVQKKFSAPEHAFELTEMAGGYQFLTKGAYHHSLAIHLKQTTRKRLSQTAMETLALVAYKQPVSKPAMEDIRGVSCDYAVQKLLEKELVAIVGRAETPGKPLLYGTTDKFMDYLGINSLEELPKPKDFRAVENSIGDQPSADIEVVEITPEEKLEMEFKAREGAELERKASELQAKVKQEEEVKEVEEGTEIAATTEANKEVTTTEVNETEETEATMKTAQEAVNTAKPDENA